MSDLTLSASSISTYEACHLQWYFTYIEVRPEPYSEPRMVGLAVHEVAEWILKNNSDSVPDFDNMSEHVASLVEVFTHEVYPTYGDPVLVEAGFELDVLGITYTGFIDSVDEHPIKPDEDTFPEYWAAELAGKYPRAEVTLRDLKTTKSRPRKGKYRDALIGYYLGARELGHEPDSIRLDYIVRTKKPYYWPEEQPVPDDDEIDLWAAQVERVANSITSGDWEATGVGTYVCNYCDHRDICGPNDRFKKMTGD
jgi:hypothetical protein